MPGIKDERDDMAEAIRYINFSGDYYKFDECKEKTKAMSRNKGILKYLTIKLEIPTEDEEDNDEDKMKIYEGNSKAWNFLIISLKDIFFGLISEYDKNTDDARKDLIDKYEALDENKEKLNEGKTCETTEGSSTPVKIQIFGSIIYTT